MITFYKEQIFITEKERFETLNLHDNEPVCMKKAILNIFFEFLYNRYIRILSWCRTKQACILFFIIGSLFGGIILGIVIALWRTSPTTESNARSMF